MDAPILAGAAGSAVVGLTGSVHCLLMCGPLACASLPLQRGPQRRAAMFGYQGGRVLAYALVGGVLGAVGGGAALALSVSTRVYLPWLMAAALVASALELGKRLRPLPALSRASRAIARASQRFSPPVRAGTIGAMTPLLPCGLLYGVFAAALAAGSFWGGTLVMLAFALGGVPALLGAQLQTALWSHRPWASFLLRRAVPLCAAAVLVYRAASVGARCH